jgi:hypothetical protein
LAAPPEAPQGAARGTFRPPARRPGMGAAGRVTTQFLKGSLASHTLEPNPPAAAGQPPTPAGRSRVRMRRFASTQLAKEQTSITANVRPSVRAYHLPPRLTV